jgi:hypothetical protein
MTTADDVDQDDDDPAMASPAQLAGAVHGPVEVGSLSSSGGACGASLSLIRPVFQFGVDAHLLAGHGIQGEAGGHLGDARGPLGDDHEVDQHETEKTIMPTT